MKGKKNKRVAKRKKSMFGVDKWLQKVDLRDLRDEKDIF